MIPSSPAPGSLLALCYGTRPQVIKASLLIDALSERWRVLTMDTGQHYDYELNAGLYDALGVRRPDYFLDVGSASHAEQTAATVTRAAEVFERERPALAVVIGDTNSTLGCALAAAKMRIPVVHVEAGLRAADVLMAEDINRRLVDELAGLLCTPSSLATAELHTRRVPGTIVQTGDVAYDVLLRNAGRAESVRGSSGWPADPDVPYIFATLHRAELTGDDALLRGVLAGLSALDVPVVFAVHPRTRAALEKEVVRSAIGENVHLLPPIGYLDAVAAVRDAMAVVTDSGGVQREAYWLGTPCITVRDETEWCETVELGANILLPPVRAREELPGLVRARAASRRAGWRRTAYGSGDAARHVAEAVAKWVDGSRDARKQQVS